MKNRRLKKLLMLLLFPISIMGQNAYVEWNVGVAYIDLDDFEIPCPGTSVLFGNTFETENNLLIDAEVGLAFPSIVTGKIGIGKYLNKENKSAFIVGVRPWPMHLYTQINLPNRKRGQWIFSVEIGAEELLEETNLSAEFDGFSLYSVGLVSIGYRWSLFKRKSNK